jgi:hypothetical protein
LKLFLLRNQYLTELIVRLFIIGFAVALGLELFSSSDTVQCAGRDTWAEDDSDSDGDVPDNQNQPRLRDAIAKYAVGGALVVFGVALTVYFGPKMVKSGLELIHQANQNMSMVLRPD